MNCQYISDVKNTINQRTTVVYKLLTVLFAFYNTMDQLESKQERMIVSTGDWL